MKKEIYKMKKNKDRIIHNIIFMDNSNKYT